MEFIGKVPHDFLIKFVHTQNYIILLLTCSTEYNPVDS